MNLFYKTLVIGLLSLPVSTVVFAESEHEQHEQHEGMHADKMAHMMSPEHLKEVQAHQLLMHDLSNKILAEKDPKKQQALKDQQLEMMRAHIAERMAKHQQMKMNPPHPIEKK